MNFRLETAKKFSLAYRQVCRPLCRELGLPQTAFDILMFLGNNPAYKTARDIVEMRRIKANLVSVHVDRLVREGYLVRRQVQGDRRKTELLCTEQAQPVIERGRQLQREFFEKLFANTDEEMRRTFSAVMGIIGNNLEAILEEEG